MNAIEQACADLQSEDRETRLASMRALIDVGVAAAEPIIQTLLKTDWRNYENPDIAQHIRRMLAGWTIEGNEFAEMPNPVNAIYAASQLGKGIYPSLRPLCLHEDESCRMIAICIVMQSDYREYRFLENIEFVVDVMFQMAWKFEQNTREKILSRLSFFPQYRDRMLPGLLEAYQQTTDGKERRMIAEITLRLRAPENYIEAIVIDCAKKHPEHVSHLMLYVRGACREAPNAPLVALVRKFTREQAESGNYDVGHALRTLFSIDDQAKPFILDLVKKYPISHHSATGVMQDMAFKGDAKVLDLMDIAFEIFDEVQKTGVDRTVVLGVFKFTLSRVQNIPDDLRRRIQACLNADIMRKGSLEFVREHLQNLDSPDKDTRKRAASRLREARGHYEHFGEKLVQLGLDATEFEANNYSYAVRELGEKLAYTAPLLIEACESEQEERRKRATEMLLGIKKPGAEHTSRIVKWLKGNEESQLRALKVLALIGPEGLAHEPDLVEAIRPLLKSESVRIRVEAIQALGAMGKAARPAAPDIVKLRHDRVYHVSSAAQRSLIRISGAAD